MEWTSATKKVIDEAALNTIADMLRRTAMRIQRHPVYAGKLRLATLTLLHELWPPSQEEDNLEYFALVGQDIDQIPTDLLEDLTASLTRTASRVQTEDRVASAAASLLAGWLKARLVELQSAAPLRGTAARLKQDHAKLINGLIHEIRIVA